MNLCKKSGRALVVLAALVLPAGSLYAAQAAPKPNFILILADDLGYGDVGCYNSQSRIPTPHLDHLATEGTRFTDAHAPDAVCTPSRYGILTGRYSFRSRLKSGVLPPWGKPLIEEGRLTLPAMLQRQGYATAALGKWHLGWDWATKDGKPAASRDGLGNLDFTKPAANGPISRGFDYYFGVDLPNFPPYCFIENNRTVGLPSTPGLMQKGGINRPGPAVAGWNLTNILPELTIRAVRYIEGAAKSPQPFFLYFSLTAPHYPVVPAAEFKGRSRAGDYGDFVTQVDATVGAVIAALARTGLATNTCLVFTSDNGPEVVEIDPGAYERIRLYHHYSMDGLRGVKRDTWEGGHRVPFIARWPGRIPAGLVSAETICHVDFMATWAALLGVKLPVDTAEDSWDIRPALFGEPLAHPAREATVLHGGGGNFAIRQGDWVLIDSPSADGNHEPEWFKRERNYTTNDYAGELYNLRDDLAQRDNLYEKRPEVVQRLKALLLKYKADGRSTPGPARPASDPKRTGSIPDEN